MKVVLIADTHNHTPDLPEGDVLVHAGDGTMMGTVDEVEKLDEWFGTLPFRDIIYVPGNHDFLFEKVHPPQKLLKNAIVLINRGVMVKGRIKCWGSPYTQVKFNWAFMRHEDKLAEFWALIPEDTDVLITHGPPRGMLDFSISKESTGSQSLLDRVRIVKPKIHVFGHIHEEYGSWHQGVDFINASLVNEFYQNVNKPIVIEV